jgi:osmotically inducible protein OsmC
MKANISKAIWRGKLKDGKGTMSIGSALDDLPFTFSSRFENGNGSNPEELIAAAHAGCFSMAFSALLAEKGFTPVQISTIAEVELEKGKDGFKITKSTLNTKAEVTSIDEATFNKLAEEAKLNCPVSSALSSVKIELNASLLS